MKVLADLYNHRSIFVLITTVLFATILFETGQQYYYVTRFNLADDVRFFYLFKVHLYKWLVWALLSIVLIFYTKRQAEQSDLDKYEIARFGGIIILLVIVNIISISTFQSLIADDEFSFQMLLSEYIPFLTFQKLPIYVLGYVFLAVMLYYYFTSRDLQVKVLELGEIKDLNTQLYNQLSNSHSDKSSVLNIKIGQQQKVIPTSEISWIEADDYCAKIHTKNNSSYVMRISLKALEEKLGSEFLRVHRKAIVNIDMISELHSNGLHRLILRDQTEVPVAKSKLKFVKECLASG